MDAVAIFVTEEEANIIQAIFERSDEPHFTVGTRKKLLDTELIQLELGVESSMSLWYLAQTVYMEREWNRKIRESLENAKRAMDAKINELKNKLNE